MKPTTIYFDMDGTIADLYGVENWLSQLRAEQVKPYLCARPLVNMQRLGNILEQLQATGVRIGIISWTSKGGRAQYNREVRRAKLEWLARNINIDFDEIHIVKYGTNKYTVAKDKNGLLFDDDEKVRDKWKGICVNPIEIDIIEYLMNGI